MSNANRPLPYTDDVETIPADEADDIQRVTQALELILSRSHAKNRIIEAVHRHNWLNNIEHRAKVVGELGTIAAGGNCPPATCGLAVESPP